METVKNYTGVDIPVLLNSTPKETLAHRRSRNREAETEEDRNKGRTETKEGRINIMRVGMGYDVHKLVDGRDLITWRSKDSL